MISQHTPAFPLFEGSRKHMFPFFDKSNSFSFFEEYHHQIEKKPKECIPAELIRTAQYCQQNYRTILPKSCSAAKQPVLTNQMLSPYIVSTLIKQFEVLVQLLVQNLLFTNSDAIKERTTLLLDTLLKRAFPESKMPVNLFRVPMSYLQSDQQFDGVSSEEPPFVDCSPVQNIYQTPLMNTINLFQELSTRLKNHSIEDKVNIIQQFQPLINLNYIPTFYQQMNKNRCKFTPIDEALLFQGLQKYTSKNLENIQEEFLWEKKIKQIKNKYKNSICSNATQNKIKQWKQNQYQYLNRSEVKCLVKGLQWFGQEKYSLVSKYFVSTRSPEFLQQEVQKAESLVKKRRKHGISEQFPDYYNQIQNLTLGESKFNPLKRVCRNNRCSQAKNLMKKLQIIEQSNNIPAIIIKDENHKSVEQEIHENNNNLHFSSHQCQSIGGGNNIDFFHYQYLENSNSLFRSQRFDFSNFNQNATFSQMFKDPKPVIPKEELVDDIIQSQKPSNYLQKPNGLQKLIPIIDFFSQK